MFIKKSKILLFITCFTLLLSCDEKPYFTAYKELDSTWKKADTLHFDFEIKDSLAAYNLYIQTRVSNDYPFNNLFLITELLQPNNQVIVDTLEYEMTHPDGTLLGTGFSEIKESQLWFKEKYKFAQKGKYRLSLNHAVRETGNIDPVNELQGVNEVGLTIEISK